MVRRLGFGCRVLVALALAPGLACSADEAPPEGLSAGPGSGSDTGVESVDTSGGTAPGTSTTDTDPVDSVGTGETGEEPPVCDPDAERPDVSSPPEGAPWRYGGGEGYPDVVHPECATVVVETFEELEASFESARPGDVIYLADHARIDMTGRSLCIPGGVTLASGRGRDGSAGGLFYSTVTETTPILRVCGSDVRVTGLRMQGSDPSQCPPEYPDNCEGPLGVNCRDCMPRSYGISCREHDHLEIDNCEISGWTASAISVTGSVDNHVHHNHLHHTQRQGLGYGVVLGRIADLPTTVLVEWNRFDYNRHAIAASGEMVQDYEARNNLVLHHANGHVFDVHGQNENTDDGTPWAGGDIRIHGNTVMVPDYRSVVIRGRPHVGAWIWNNCLAPATPDDAVLQRFHFGNLHIDVDPSGSPSANLYGQTPSACQTRRLCFEPGGVGPQHALAASGVALSSLGFGDFDGDGRTDVFRTDDSTWYWLSAGKGSWEQLNSSSSTLPSLRFGDFDGDGRTDVFSTSGGQWRYSAGGSAPWAVLREANEQVGELLFGDFDGDGRTDALRADGTNWWISSGASEPWAVVNSSSMMVTGMAVGDFDGDGRDDVFSANGSQWRFSSGAESPWETLNASGVALSGLRLADLDGDGLTDVVRVNNDRRLVVWGGKGGWEVLGHGSESLAALAFGDFDGDGRDDIFRAGCH
jgi:hypothetical protein